MDKIKILLKSAHESKNPIDALEKLLLRHPSPEMVHMLVPVEEIIRKDCEDYNSIVKDLDEFQLQKDCPCSDVAWRCRFIYYATALVHVFFDQMKRPECFFAPYPARLWLDINPDDEKPYLSLKYQWNVPKSLIKVILYVVRDLKIQEMETLKYAIDLDTGQIMPSSKGNFIQISVTNGKCALVRPNPSLVNDLVIMLTLKGDFQGVFHQEKTPLVSALHYIPDD